MPPKPDPPEPILEVLEDMVPAELHQAAWEVCQKNKWYFGHGSHPDDWNRFWKMDLDHEQVFHAIWEKARPRCEALAGGPLRVVRQYANGHTYGLGGNPHLDDTRDGTFTLLYYPNLEWKDGWDGETVYYDERGEVALAVRPRPNRAVFFDSRILHNGRAPSRLCPALRVTVAYKLERLDSPPLASAPTLERADTPAAEPTHGAFRAREVSRNGAQRVHEIQIPASTIDAAVNERLQAIANSVRLPGFREGKVPANVLRDRYGSATRSEVLNRFVAEATERALPKGSVVYRFDLERGVDEGDVEFQVASTFLPSLPALDASALNFEHWTYEETDAAALGIAAEALDEAFRERLKLQVLDHLDSAYEFPQLPKLVEREFASLWQTASTLGELPAGQEERNEAMQEFRAIAARRLRLGVVVTELARRFEITAPEGAQLEARVIDRILSLAHVSHRRATLEEIREWLKG